LNFSCNKCQRRYSIADEKVRGKTVKIRCKNCQNVISVEGPPLEVEESTRVVSLADVERLRAQERSLAEEEAAAASPEVAEPEPGEQSPWDDEPTRAVPIPTQDASVPWFAMVQGKQEGPLEEPGLRELVDSGAISPRTYFWQQGMADWKRGSDIPELASLFAQPEPLPAPAPVYAEPPPVEPQPEPSGPSSTSWQPEPPGPSQTTWQVEPTQPVHQQPEDTTPWAQEEETTPAPSSAAPLGELFSDLDLPQSEAGFSDEEGLLPPEEEQEESYSSPEEETRNERTPVEHTRQYIQKAGVERRNPFWKIALFLFLLLAVPVGLLYLLTELRVVPLTVTRVDAQGRAVEQPVSVFSSEGMGELRELLLGNKKQPVSAVAPVVAPEAKARPAPEAKEPSSEQPEEDPELKELYAEGKEDVAPEVRAEAEVAATDSAEQSGLPQEEIARVVSKSQSAFQSCIERALRKKSRRFRGLKVVLTATVNSSGEVKKATLDRKDVDGSDMGECLKESAKRMAFPSFAGDDVDVEIPLVLTKSL